MLLCFQLGEISPRRPTFMIFTRVFFQTARPGRNFAQLSSQCEFGIVQHFVIPFERPFVFLNLGSPHLI